jgi:hypothetical protein
MRFVRPGAPSATDAPTALRAHVEPTLVLWWHPPAAPGDFKFHIPLTVTQRMR